MHQDELDRFDIPAPEAARILGVHRSTLLRWARDGKVRSFLTPGGQWRFRKADLDALLPPQQEHAFG